jgi:tricarballylate dehydrogenase
MVDVLVIGGGNAALCAALMAREAGASVLLLEAAPRERQLAAHAQPALHA